MIINTNTRPNVIVASDEELNLIALALDALIDEYEGYDGEQYAKVRVAAKVLREVNFPG